MSAVADVRKFEEWALKMGCPSECLPKRNAMTRIFQSGQTLAFQTMMQRVRPKDEVKCMRDNKAVHTIRKLDGSGLTHYSNQNIPEQLVRHNTIKKLNERVAETKKQMFDSEANYAKLRLAVKDKNIKKHHLHQKFADIHAKCLMVNAREDNVHKELLEEDENTRNILNAKPVKIQQNNSSEKVAQEAIAAAVAELQKYYSNIENDNYTETVSATLIDQLWNKLHTIFAKIPNYVLWNALNVLKDRQLAEINVMSKLNIAKLLQIEQNNSTALNGFQIAVGKMYAQHISLMADIHLCKIEKERLVNDYMAAYNAYVTNMQTKYALFNNTDIEDDLLHDYIKQYSASRFKQAQIEFFERQVELNEKEIEDRAQGMNDHNIILNSLRCIYDDIEKLYCTMREDLRALASVQEKIRHNEGMLKYLIDCENEKHTQKLIAGGGSGTLSAGINQSNSQWNSYSSSDDSSVTGLSNATLDSTISSTMTAKPGGVFIPLSKAVYIPQLLKEFQLFLDIPLVKFNLYLSPFTALDLNGNILLNPSVFKDIPVQMHDLISGHTLTTRAFLNELKTLVDWHQRQAILHRPSKIDKNILIHVDVEKFNQMKRHQMEKLTEILDSTGNIQKVITDAMRKLEIHLKFLIDNRLRKYIRKSRLFNGRSYHEYETEFMMYYNMVVAFKNQNQNRKI